MKPVITLLLFMGIFIAINAQSTLRYSYDASGNRTYREIVLSRNADDLNLNQKHTANYYEEEIGKVQLRIYPNPVKSILKVAVDGFTGEISAECLLFNISGIMIEQRILVDQETQIDMSNCQSGHYVLQIIVNGEKTTWKIIKE